MTTFYALTWISEDDGLRRYLGPVRNPPEGFEGAVLLSTEAPNGHEARYSNDLVMPEDRGAFSVHGKNLGTNACYNSRDKARRTAREESLRSWSDTVTVSEHKNEDDFDGSPVAHYWRGLLIPV